MRLSHAARERGTPPLSWPRGDFFCYYPRAGERSCAWASDSKDNAFENSRRRPGKQEGFTSSRVWIRLKRRDMTKLIEPFTDNEVGDSAAVHCRGMMEAVVHVYGHPMRLAFVRPSQFIPGCAAVL